MHAIIVKDILNSYGTAQGLRRVANDGGRRIVKGKDQPVDRLTSMSVFANVAAQRSFSAAARTLGISQATASKHVQMLETWLGSRLLHRTTRRVGLTEAGEVFFAQCQRILDDLEDAQQAGRPGARLRGSLSLTAPVAFGSARLAGLLVEFMEQHPQLQLTVTLSDRPTAVIDDGYDLALRVDATPPRGAEELGWAVYRLAMLRFTVCAAPAYLQARSAPAVPSDLADHACVTDGRHPGDVWHFRTPAANYEVTVGGTLRSDNALLRHGAARAGAGVLLAPEFLVEDDIQAGRLVRLLPDFEPEPAGLDAVCPMQRAASPKVRGLIAYLSGRFGGSQTTWQSNA